MIFYRIGNAAFRRRIPLVPLLCNALIRLFNNCVVDTRMQIGKGSQFAYGGIATVVHAKAVIGEQVMIGQCVTIGGRSGHPTLPVIEDHVYIGAGAQILGPVTIGAHAVIGANAVVIQDVPPHAVVAGVPARIIRIDA